VVRASIAIACVALLALSGAGAARSQAQNVHGALYAAAPSSVRHTGVVLVFSRAGRQVARAKTGSAGHFALRLSPGLYTVRALRRPTVKPGRFRVPEIGVVVLTLRLAR
jgi:hypothetical protein